MSQNRMNNKRLILFLLVSITIYSMVFWAFVIREHIPAKFHYLYPLIFIFLFVLHNVVANWLIKNFPLLRNIHPLGSLLFFGINIYFLLSVSSVKRENEIRNYFSRNEHSLANIVHHFDSYGDDVRMQELKQEMKLERVFRRAEYLHNDKKDFLNVINMRLYTCAGYGYGVLYSCDPEINQPENLGGSPVTNWMKLKDHWFYYSIFD